MKVKLVTPVRNGRRFLEKTFDSVLRQATPGLTIHYHVQDGNSTDDTIGLCALYAPRFAEAGVVFSYASEKDTGMYDALAKGFRRLADVNCEVNAYINAGDYFAPRAFRNIAATMQAFGVDWVTGLNVKYNSEGDIVAVKTPGPYPQGMMSHGIFGYLLPCVQQESTFWSGRLHALIDLDKLATFKLAGDFYLWKSFGAHARLITLKAWVSGFTIEEGQLSQVHRAAYDAEVKAAASPRWHDYLTFPMVGATWLLPDKFRRAWFPDSFVDVPLPGATPT